MDDDHKYMMRAIELAKRAEGRTSPNPMVGCVLVNDGVIVGEGWHKGRGLAHAEVEAIAAAGAKAAGASAYVTLEPCNHHGNTPPCSEAVLKAGIKEVVYACADPNPLAAGGAARLSAEGVQVRAGVGESQARALNRSWFHAIKNDRPYVFAKFAMSLDGKIATSSGESQWITGTQSRDRGHQLRHAIDVIIVGAETVLADDPALTARPEGQSDPANPVRVVLDSAGRTSPGAKAFERSAPGPVLATTDQLASTRRKEFEQHGVEILTLSRGADGRPDIEELLQALRSRGFNSVMIEGGGEVLGSFFDAGLVDEVWAFVAPVIIGGGGKSPVAGAGVAALADAFRLTDRHTEILGSDIFVRGRVGESEAR